MLKIGDLSRLARVSVKALRHYDDLGLLEPVRTDDLTGYRYYSVEQLGRLNRVLALKDLGLSLAQVSRLLDEGTPTDQIRGMLRLRRAEQRERVREEQERLSRVEARLQQIEQEEDIMAAYDVVLKRADAQLVASARAVLPTPADQVWLFREVEEHVARHGPGIAGFPTAIYHDPEYRERDLDIEVLLPVSVAIPGGGGVSIRELPAVERMACVVHHGGYDTLGEAYAPLFGWIEANGYRVSGPCREANLRFGAIGTDLRWPAAYLTADPDEYVTEIQLPVEKAR